MHYVVKLGGSYLCKLSAYVKPQWWDRNVNAIKYQTLVEARKARDEMRHPSMPAKAAHKGRCDCSLCSTPRVVRVRTRADLRSERVAAKAIVEAACRLAALRAARAYAYGGDGYRGACNAFEAHANCVCDLARALEAARAGRGW